MLSNYRLWWQKPQLVTDQSAKRVTWLELFFDLIFVVVISRLAHHLMAHPNGKTLLEFIILFIPVWWTWIGITYYNERFETFDLSFRFFTFLQLLAVGGMAANVGGGLSETQFGFALSYAFARFLLMWMWFRAGRHNSPLRPVTNVFVLGSLLSLLLWVAAAFILGPLGLFLKGFGLLVDLLIPMLTFNAQRQFFPMEARKLPERFGLFVLIVLGENLVGVVNGLTGVEHPDGLTFIRFVLAMLLGFGLWWIYFDFIGRREPLPAAAPLFAWAYLHLPLVLAITAMGSMNTYTVTLNAEAMDSGVRWILSFGFAVFYLTVAALEFTVEHEQLINPTYLTLLRIGTAFVALLLPLLPISMLGLVVGLVGLHLIHMLVGAAAWFKSEHAGRTDFH